MTEFSIYQINMDRDSANVCFIGMESLEKIKGTKKVNAAAYDRVYDGKMDCISLENIYQKFNVDHPADYTGRSLSVSDVVEIRESDTLKPGFYFVDSIGFKTVSYTHLKQKFASQIMTSKSPVRSCEDIDETALSYAEIKMLATGNPHIKEKMDLDIQVQKLRLLKSSFLSEKYALEDKIIKFYPQEIARRSDVIAGLKSDIERVAEHPKPSDETFVGMTVKGAFYSEKADAGNAILEACKAMTNPEPIPLGEYRGFTMELYFEAREYKVRLKGELGYPVTLGTDTFGNITRLDNALEGLLKRLEMNEMELDNIKKQFETAKVDVERPFPQEEELKAKTDRLNELNALLNVDKRENEIVGGEPDEGEEPPEKKPRNLER